MFECRGQETIIDLKDHSYFFSPQKRHVNKNGHVGKLSSKIKIVYFFFHQQV